MAYSLIQRYSIYYIIKDLPEDTRAAGRAVVKSFGVKSRFVHFEFFRMTENQASMGEKGQIVALEVNMRPCGGFTPDMINFARSTNVYKIWADMIAFGGTDMPVGEQYRVLDLIDGRYRQRIYRFFLCRCQDQGTD